MLDDDPGSAAALLSEIDDTGTLRLRGTRCRHDSEVTFPPERFGCQRCGAHDDDLEEVLLPARGRLVDTVVVHRHRGPGPVAPFAIGTIALVNGPVIRSLVDPDTASGDAVDGRVEKAADGTSLVWFGRTGSRA